MTTDRLFLSWTQPCLHAAVDELVRRYAREGALDLERVMVVLPGARGGRRLIELLVARAERDALRLIPPMTATPGSLPEALVDAERPAANDLARKLAWVYALQAAEPAALEKVFPRRPAAEDFESWLSLAGLCEKLHAELAGDLLTFADVAERGGELTHFNEQDRWRALETVRRLYIERLNELGLADPHEARIAAVERGACRSEKSIIVVATPELNRVVRRMLEQVGERVSVWIFAPVELADRFNELGCTLPEMWRDATIELRTEQVEIVERPADQAAAVLGTIAGYGGNFTASEITVGVPDDEVVPYIEQQFEQRGLVAHHAAGLPLERTGPFRLLKVAADFIERWRSGDFAAIVRHPDVEAWLNSPAPLDDWIGELDAFTAEHLQATLRGDSFSALPEANPLRQVFNRVRQWLEPLAGSKPLNEWAGPILDAVLAVYGDRPLDRNHDADRVLIQTGDAMHKILRQLESLDSQARPTVDAATALRLVLRMVQSEPIAPPPRRDSIELLGWLELPLDDAPALIVTGFNEGLVPDSINADAFLPNQLRHHLGLMDNDRRYARDAYALSAVLTARPQTKLIAGRRKGDLEPLTPSRLLFACDDRAIAERIERFFPESPAPHEPKAISLTEDKKDKKGVRNLLFGQKVPDTFLRSKAISLTLRAGASRFEVPRAIAPAKPITSMRVTSFKDYLACPYRFYLRHVLKLDAVEPANELDPLGFGSLAHEVLARFGRAAIKDSTDADAIREFLMAELRELVDDRFGDDAVPAVRVQIEQLRLRLDSFATRQAEWRVDGWRIEHTEFDVSGERAAIDVDGAPMFLRGRIDRIDRHERRGKWCVLDYKTSERGNDLKDARGKDGTWHDLQLPLYRHLARAAGVAAEMLLGYFVLPRDPKGVEVMLADWKPEDLLSADEAARQVIRGVRAGEFPGPVQPPPRGFDAYAWICQEGRTAPVLDDNDEEDAA